MSESNQEIELPDNIMPTIEECNTDIVQQVHEQEIGKKHKVWGPIQPARQSKRIDRSKNVMEKAQELKQKSNLDMPKKNSSIYNVRYNAFKSF
jgi:hypothetical protein